MSKEINNEKEAVANAVSRTEQFLENNRKNIIGAVIAIVVIALAGYLYYKFVQTPRKTEALAQMYKAENNFREGNFDLALSGDGNVMGFEEIISEYGSKAGESVYLYAAICNMQKDSVDADAAISLINKYSTSDPILAGRAQSVKGDAFVVKGEYAKAAACFEKAAKVSDCPFSAAYLLKAGLAYEAIEENAKALAAYKNIKDNYPQSIEAYDIDKYITRLAVKE